MGDTWTQAQADSRFLASLTDFGNQVMSYLRGDRTQGQFDGMTSLAYNIGVSAFGKSTLCRKHNAGDYEGAAEEFLRWDKQAGKVLRGLTIRRAKEREMYLSGD
jgi:lysozyme